LTRVQHVRTVNPWQTLTKGTNMNIVDNETKIASAVKDNTKVKHIKSVIKVTPASDRVVASKECGKIIEELRELDRQAKTIKRLIEEKQAMVKAELGDNGREILDLKGNIGATWKFDKDSICFDKDKFEKAMPKTYAKFLKTKTGSRKFCIK